MNSTLNQHPNLRAHCCRSRAAGAPATAAELAKQFRQAKPATEAEILKTLETLGPAQCTKDGKFQP
jgi:hypothetical protein